jgi:transcriptional regulator with XRE-family HTH domain
MVIRFLGYDPYTTKEGLGGKIIRARRALGMTQKELAGRLGVDPSALGYWERGGRRPTRELEDRVSIFLGS